jgi:hypothetical protein
VRACPRRLRSEAQRLLRSRALSASREGSGLRPPVPRRLLDDLPPGQHLSGGLVQTSQRLLPLRRILRPVDDLFDLVLGLVDHLLDLVLRVTEILFGLTRATIGLTFGFEVLVALLTGVVARVIGGPSTWASTKLAWKGEFPLGGRPVGSVDGTLAARRIRQADERRVRPCTVDSRDGSMRAQRGYGRHREQHGALRRITVIRGSRPR